MTDDPNRRAERAYRVQEQLQSWFLLTFPFTSIDVIVAALSYEIARIVATKMPADIDIDATLNQVMGIMRQQIDAHRAGRLPE